MKPADDSRDRRRRIGAIVAMLVTPWRAGRIVGCAAAFAVASIVVLRIASEASALPLVVVRWLVD